MTPCSSAMLNTARRASTVLLNAEADIPDRFIFALGAMNPVPSRNAFAAHARQSLAVRRRMSRAVRSGPSPLIRSVTPIVLASSSKLRECQPNIAQKYREECQSDEQLSLRRLNPKTSDAQSKKHQANGRV